MARVTKLVKMAEKAKKVQMAGMAYKQKRQIWSKWTHLIKRPYCQIGQNGENG